MASLRLIPWKRCCLFCFREGPPILHNGDGHAEEYIGARDPIGIRPLDYGHDKKGVRRFDSEANIEVAARLEIEKE